MANGPANRGSLFNVRRAVIHSLRRFILIFSNVLYSRFAIQCSQRRSPFAAPFAICLVIRRVVRNLPRCSPFASSFAAPFAIDRAISYSFSTIFAIQTSLFNVCRAVSHSHFTIRQSPSHSQFAAPFAVAFQCPLTLSIDTSACAQTNNFPLTTRLSLFTVHVFNYIYIFIISSFMRILKGVIVLLHSL